MKFIEKKATSLDLWLVLVEYSDERRNWCHMYKDTVIFEEFKNSLVGKLVTEEELEELVDLSVRSKKAGHYCENDGGCCL